MQELLDQELNEFSPPLRGLSVEELVIASDWLHFISVSDKDRVLKAVELTLGMQGDANHRHPDREIGFAILAAGSSLYAPTYNDVDLFVVPETWENGVFAQGTRLLGHIGDVVQSIPGCVFIHGNYDTDRSRSYSLDITFLLDTFDFEFPRPETEGDVVYHPGLNAEEIIALNRRENSQFLVLARSYTAGTPNVNMSGLDPSPEDVVARCDGDLSWSVSWPHERDFIEQVLDQATSYETTRITPLGRRKEILGRAMNELGQRTARHTLAQKQRGSFVTMPADLEEHLSEDPDGDFLASEITRDYRARRYLNARVNQIVHETTTQQLL